MWVRTLMYMDANVGVDVAMGVYMDGDGGVVVNVDVDRVANGDGGCGYMLM